MAYARHNIKLSPKKCTFFPDELTILGVSFTPVKAELALDNETEEEKEKPIDKCKTKRISRAIPEMQENREGH